MAIIARILVVIFAYILACIAASLVLTIGILTPDWDNSVAFASPGLPVGLVVGIGAFFIACLAILPALLVIALGEGFALRSSLYYAAVGGALALSVTYGLDLAGYVGEPDVSVARVREVLAAAGIAGGLVYWLFAGRKAGFGK